MGLLLNILTRGAALHLSLFNQMSESYKCVTKPSIQGFFPVWEQITDAKKTPEQSIIQCNAIEMSITVRGIQMFSQNCCLLP